MQTLDLIGISVMVVGIIIFAVFSWLKRDVTPVSVTIIVVTVIASFVLWLWPVPLLCGSCGKEYLDTDNISYCTSCGADLLSKEERGRFECSCGAILWYKDDYHYCGYCGEEINWDTVFERK